MSSDELAAGRGATMVESGASQMMSPAANETMRARCWGTRGSMPSPGIATAGYGGNTSCVEVKVRGRHFIFDAGTGIRLLGERLAAEAEPPAVDLFLTHFHWDHIQGLPFFAPLYNPMTTLAIHGAKQGDIDIQTLIAGQMGPIYFPVPFEQVAAHLEFEHLNDEPWVGGGVEVHALRVRHPAHTYGYKIAAGEVSMAYIPDNELAGGEYPLGAKATYEKLIQFLSGVDVLYHDAMFSDTEYGRREGWGHSTFNQTVQLAEAAGVRRLYLFHHAPERTDVELSRILVELQNDVARRGSALQLGVAAEGEELMVSR
jgi:phosphoribosyl 1,2-cyclic phosphodiesterase